MEHFIMNKLFHVKLNTSISTGLNCEDETKMIFLKLKLSMIKHFARGMPLLNCFLDGNKTNYTRQTRLAKICFRDWAWSCGFDA